MRSLCDASVSITTTWWPVMELCVFGIIEAASPCPVVPLKKNSALQVDKENADIPDIYFLNNYYMCGICSVCQIKKGREHFSVVEHSEGLYRTLGFKTLQKAVKMKAHEHRHFNWKLYFLLLMSK